MILSKENQFNNYQSMTQQKNLNSSNLYFILFFINILIYSYHE